MFKVRIENNIVGNLDIYFNFLFSIGFEYLKLLNNVS